MKYELLDTEILYEGFFRLNRYRVRHSLFAGGWSGEIVRERLERMQAASVLLYDPQRDEVVLIEQFRIGALDDANGAWLLEIVGGLIKEGENPADVARREAMEEAGCEIQELLPICEFLASPGTACERIHLFCGRVDASKAGGIHGVDEEGEDIRVEVMKADDAIAELYVGRANSTTILVALQWLAIHRRELGEAWKR